MNVKDIAPKLPIVCLCLVPHWATAASFQILEQSPAQLGKAFAGTASDVQDATTVFFNPAAMTQVDGNMISGGLNIIRAGSEFQDEGSNTNGRPGETEEVAFVPNLYAVTRLNNQWSLGLGINAPYGLSSSYDSDWYGRYLATDSDLQVLNVNATAAYQLNQQWSFGAGINYQRTEVTLENSVDSTFGAAPNIATDSYVEIEGDDTDFVIDLSAYWQPSEQMAFGLVWRQGGSFNLSGRADFTLSEACLEVITGCAASLGALEGNIAASVDLPDTLTLSGSYQLDPNWEIHADIARTDWSSISVVDVVNTEIGATLDRLELRYDDTTRVSLGATYTSEGPWQWRFGVALDDAPQTNPVFVTPRIPDADRVWLSGGFNYQWSQTLSFDVGYAHLFVDDLSINSITETPAPTAEDSIVVGSFDSSVDILGAQVNWRY